MLEVIKIICLFGMADIFNYYLQQAVGYILYHNIEHNYEMPISGDIHHND